MKRVMIVALVLMLVLLSSCSVKNESQQSTVSDKETINTEEDSDMISITMSINGEKAEVTWENNESVKALAKLAAESPLTIDTSMYGGFEQVGSIGTDLPSNDVSITTEPGDIVLYTGNNIVVFYGSNSWSYTRLGHIENKSDEELKDILGGNNVEITLSIE
ncbi:MAG: hypothetical protein IKF42_03175 [Mogibacterium sp.]|nr:hypothetical protein [Mogibacterium sp.]